jgi:phage terminase Nu1 subunit (DNA packaging protein)
MSERPKADSPTVEVGTLSKLFNLTAVRVQQLASDGVIVKHARGRYDLWASIRNYIKFLQERKVNQWSGAEGEPDGYTQHRARLTKAKADKAEVEAALVKGTAHDAQAVAAVWEDMIGNARAKLLALPTKLAAQLEGMTIAERQEAIQAAVAQALTELSEYSPEAVTGEYIRTHQPEEEDDELDADPEPNE